LDEQKTRSSTYMNSTTSNNQQISRAKNQTRNNKEKHRQPKEKEKMQQAFSRKSKDKIKTTGENADHFKGFSNNFARKLKHDTDSSKDRKQVKMKKCTQNSGIKSVVNRIQDHLTDSRGRYQQSVNSRQLKGKNKDIPKQTLRMVDKPSRTPSSKKRRTVQRKGATSGRKRAEE